MVGSEKLKLIGVVLIASMVLIFGMMTIVRQRSHTIIAITVDENNNIQRVRANSKGISNITWIENSVHFNGIQVFFAIKSLEE